MVSITVFKETDLFVSRRTDVFEDDWPEIELLDAQVTVHSPRHQSLRAKPCSLFDADENRPVRVVGRVKLNKDQKHLLIKPRKQKEFHIELPPVFRYAYGQYEDGEVIFWALGNAGWFRIVPAESYKQHYDQMLQVTRVLYFLYDLYFVPKDQIKTRVYSNKPENKSAEEIFELFSKSHPEDAADADEAEQLFYKNHEFLIHRMQKHPEGIKWAKTKIWGHLQDMFPRSFTGGGTSPEPDDDSPPPVESRKDRRKNKRTRADFEESTASSPPIPKRQSRKLTSWMKPTAAINLEDGADQIFQSVASEVENGTASDRSTKEPSPTKEEKEKERNLLQVKLDQLDQVQGVQALWRLLYISVVYKIASSKLTLSEFANLMSTQYKMASTEARIYCVYHAEDMITLMQLGGEVPVKWVNLPIHKDLCKEQLSTAQIQFVKRFKLALRSNGSLLRYLCDFSWAAVALDRPESDQKKRAEAESVNRDELTVLNGEDKVTDHTDSLPPGLARLLDPDHHQKRRVRPKRLYGNLRSTLKGSNKIDFSIQIAPLEHKSQPVIPAEYSKLGGKDGSTLLSFQLARDRLMGTKREDLTDISPMLLDSSEGPPFEPPKLRMIQLKSELQQIRIPSEASEIQPNRPGDVWECEVDHCYFSAYNVSTPQGKLDIVHHLNRHTQGQSPDRIRADNEPEQWHFEKEEGEASEQFEIRSGRPPLLLNSQMRPYGHRADTFIEVSEDTSLDSRDRRNRENHKETVVDDSIPESAREKIPTPVDEFSTFRGLLPDIDGALRREASERPVNYLVSQLRMRGGGMVGNMTGLEQYTRGQDYAEHRRQMEEERVKRERRRQLFLLSGEKEPDTSEPDEPRTGGTDAEEQSLEQERKVSKKKAAASKARSSDKSNSSRRRSTRLLRLGGDTPEGHKGKADSDRAASLEPVVVKTATVDTTSKKGADRGKKKAKKNQKGVPNGKAVVGSSSTRTSSPASLTEGKSEGQPEASMRDSQERVQARKNVIEQVFCLSDSDSEEIGDDVLGTFLGGGETEKEQGSRADGLSEPMEEAARVSDEGGEKEGERNDGDGGAFIEERSDVGEARPGKEAVAEEEGPVDDPLQGEPEPAGNKSANGAGGKAAVTELASPSKEESEEVAGRENPEAVVAEPEPKPDTTAPPAPTHPSGADAQRSPMQTEAGAVAESGTDFEDAMEIDPAEAGGPEPEVFADAMDIDPDAGPSAPEK